MHFVTKQLCLVLITLSAIFSFLSCKSKPDNVKARKDAPVIVDVMIARSSPVNSELEANGTVLANEYVELHPEVSGRLTYLDVPEGSNVSKGTVIARINDADLRAQLSKTNVQLELAVQTEQRLRKLLDINGVNQADYDAAMNQVNSLKADLAITQAAIEKTIIRAPFNGVIGLRQVSPGAYVSPETVIATLQQVTQIKIDFTLPENYSSSLRKGSIVDVQIDEAQNLTRKAVIIATEPQINQTTRNLKVRALLQQGKGNPGSFVKVTINTGAEKTAILVPTTSIIPSDMDKQLIVVRNGKAAFVNVKTGLRTANDVEITSGIKEGDSVVVTGVLFARDKAPVKIRSVKEQEKMAANEAP